MQLTNTALLEDSLVRRAAPDAYWRRLRRSPALANGEGLRPGAGDPELRPDASGVGSALNAARLRRTRFARSGGPHAFGVLASLGGGRPARRWRARFARSGSTPRRSEQARYHSPPTQQTQSPQRGPSSQQVQCGLKQVKRCGGFAGFADCDTATASLSLSLLWTFSFSLQSFFFMVTLARGRMPKIAFGAEKPARPCPSHSLGAFPSGRVAWRGQP